LQESADEAAAQGGSFLLDPGVYTARLAKVEATQAKSSGAAMWALEFDEVRTLDGKKCAGRQWTNLVLTDAVMWKVGQFFAAFGVPSSTNTDELINHRCRLQIGKRVIQQGSRAGQEGNEVNGFTLLASTDEGYDRVAKLISRFGGQAPAAAPAAQAASAAQPAAASAPAAAAAVGGGDSEVDF
jgi:hypothetical protein